MKAYAHAAGGNGAAAGVVLGGEITLSIADVDLVDLCLRLLITPAEERPR